MFRAKKSVHATINPLDQDQPNTFENVAPEVTQVKGGIEPAGSNKSSLDELVPDDSESASWLFVLYSDSASWLLFLVICSWLLFLVIVLGYCSWLLHDTINPLDQVVVSDQLNTFENVAPEVTQ